MKKNSRILILALTVIFMASLPVMGQYRDHGAISRKAAELARQYPDLCSANSLVKTAGGKEIWLITIGTGNRDSKPGVAIAGGIDGRYILGRELALGVAENILKNSAESNIRELLGRITFYIFPDVSPDASDQFFSGLKYERSINSRTTDDDRDFLFDEDPCEDLNKDGVISLIRIKDPAGNYIESDEDKRVMIPADISKGQAGN